MLHYVEQGSGQPIVFVHAFPLNASMWAGELEAFSTYGRVIAPDLPGFGRSARQAEPSVPGMAAAIAELLESIGVNEPVIISGLSMGGYVTFEFARQFPDRVKAVGLCSTKAGLDTPEAKATRFKTADRIRAEGLEAMAPVFMPNLLGDTTRARQPKVAERVKAIMLENDKDGVADSLIAMAHRRDSTDLLSQITCPTLVAGGLEDAFIPFKETERMHRHIKQSMLASIPDAGHLVNLEQPQHFHAVFEHFLKSVLTSV